MGLIITFVLGLFILFGAFASYVARGHKIIEQFSVSMALGTLSMLAILELLPESVEHLGIKNWWLVLLCAVIGLVILKAFDHFIPDHDAHYAQHGHHHEYTEGNVTHVGFIAAIAVTLHNIIEGMAVYSIAEQSVTTGIMVAIGVGLHNIPMGMILYSTLHKKWNRIIMITSATVSSFIGGILMHLLWGYINDTVIGMLIAVTLGMVAYIVIFELIPMVVHLKKWKTTGTGVAIGVFFILISLFFE